MKLGRLNLKYVVTPAKAGGHPLTVRFKLTVPGMDSRLRGNDEYFVMDASA